MPSFLSLLFMGPLLVIRLTLWLGAWTFIYIGLGFAVLYDGIHPCLTKVFKGKFSGKPAFLGK